MAPTMAPTPGRGWHRQENKRHIEQKRKTRSVVVDHWIHLFAKKKTVMTTSAETVPNKQPPPMTAIEVAAENLFSLVLNT